MSTATKHIEFEATFFPVPLEEARTKLSAIGATCVREEFMQTRVCYDVTPECLWEGAWVRVRDEGEQITLTIKAFPPDNDGEMQDQREVEIVADSFEAADDFCRVLGLRKKSYQETKRELWQVGGVSVMIDTWPWLPTYVEIEGSSEQEVALVAERLGFD